MGPVNQPLHLSPLPIIDAVAAVYGVSRSDLLRHDRRPRLVEPRQLAVSLVRQLTSYSFPELGKFFRRDHSTLIYAVRSHELRALKDGKLAMRERAIRRSFR